MRLYCLPGLGADHRVFQFLNISEAEIIPLHWLKPQKQESLKQYAVRMASQIDDEEFYLLGLSFGGIVAREMCFARKPIKLLLVSSPDSRKSFPRFIQLSISLRLEVFASFRPFYSLNWITKWMFGPKSKESQKLLHQILKDTDPSFARWSLKTIRNWKAASPDVPTSRIIGERDRLVDFSETESQIVRDASHFMIVDEAETLSSWISKQLLSS